MEIFKAGDILIDVTGDLYLLKLENEYIKDCFIIIHLYSGSQVGSSFNTELLKAIGFKLATKEQAAMAKVLYA